MINKSKLPVFDPAKDGNPFWWIIQTADQVRQQRDAERGKVVKQHRKF